MQSFNLDSAWDLFDTCLFVCLFVFVRADKFDTFSIAKSLQNTCECVCLFVCVFWRCHGEILDAHWFEIWFWTVKIARWKWVYLFARKMCSSFKMYGIFVYFKFDLTPCECSRRFDWGLSTLHCALWILIAFCVNFRRSFFGFSRCLVHWVGVSVGEKWNRKPSSSIIWNFFNNFLRRYFCSLQVKTCLFPKTKMALDSYAFSMWH